MKTIIERLFELSDISIKNDDFPVSAIIFNDNYEIISEGYNKRNLSNKTVDHAEIIAITAANEKLNSWRLDDCNMIVTLEPCDMCNTVIREARLKKVFYIVPRYEYKNISNKTIFEKFDFCDKKYDKKTSKYIREISNFFVDKR